MGRSGSGTRPGFEGGQTPLYRKLPKLKGIAGGNRKGQSQYVTVNLKDLDCFSEGDEVSLETLCAKRKLNPSGRDRKLPLKVLGTGELNMALTFKAQAFSSSAIEKINTAGGTVEELPAKEKWIP